MKEGAEERHGWGVLLRREWLAALAVLLGGILLHSMNVLMLATVLPTIVGELGGARADEPAEHRVPRLVDHRRDLRRPRHRDLRRAQHLRRGRGGVHRRRRA